MPQMLELPVLLRGLYLPPLQHTTEIVLNMLAEATTTTLSRKQKPQTFSDNVKVACQGGSIAGNTRKEIETATGESVVTPQNAAQLNTLFMDIIEGVADDSNEEEK